MGTEMGSALAKVGATLIGAPTFSVLAERPRLDQVFNLRRMFTVLSELEELGLPVFPNVFAGNNDDVDAWTNWLVERPKVWVVGTVIQRQVPAFFEDLVTKLVRLQQALSTRQPPLHVVLFGVGSPKRALKARQLGLRHFACVSSNASMAAGHGRRLHWTGSDLIATRDRIVDRNSLLRDNVRAEMAAFAIVPRDGGLIYT